MGAVFIATIVPAVRETKAIPIQALPPDLKVKLTGIVAAEPEIRTANTKLIIASQKIQTKGYDLPVVGKLLATVARGSKYNYGDTISISGKLRPPEDFSETFSYRRYLAGRGIDALLLSVSRIEIVGQSVALPELMVRSILDFKSNISQSIEKMLHEPYAQLLRALILGDRARVDDNILTDFKTSGVLHVIAISGSHVVLLASMVNLLRDVWPPWGRRLLLLAILIVFVVLTGGTASVVRAAVMGALAVSAEWLRRINHPRNVLALSAALMIGLQPAILFNDVGFQLSFLAVAGLMFFSKPISRLLGGVPQRFGLREALSMTLASQLTTMPIAVHQFDQVSLVAPLANVLILPAVEIVLILGLATSLVSLLLPAALMIWLAAPLYYLEKYMVFVAHELARLPLSTASGVKTFSWVWDLVTVLIIIMLWKYAKKLRH